MHVQDSQLQYYMVNFVFENRVSSGYDLYIFSQAGNYKIVTTAQDKTICIWSTKKTSTQVYHIS